MAFTGSSYNGWSAEVRNVRGAISYSRKNPRATGSCQLCGQRRGSLTWHAEEYGSCLKDFLDHEIELCAYCHGMIHARFRHPGRWFRYLRRLDEHRNNRDLFGHAPAESPFAVFHSMGSFFKEIQRLPQIKVEHGQSGVPWLDALVLGRYDGPVKIATVEGEGTDDLRPDPRIYTTPDLVPPQGVVVEWQADRWTYSHVRITDDGNYQRVAA